MKKLFVATLALTALTATGKAEEKKAAPAAESTTSVGAVTPKDAPVKKEGEQDVDEVITNRKLRAETGAKSLFSFSAALSYSGGTVNDPLADTRPNIAAGKATPTAPGMSGTIGVKYKLSSTTSLSGDAGVTARRPSQGKDGKVTVANPSLTYQMVYQAAGIQNVSKVGLTGYTDNFYRDIGYLVGMDLSQTAITDFGGSKFSAGLAADLSLNAFDKDTNSDQSDYSFAFYPFAEYEISDKLNLRTVFRPFIYEHTRGEDLNVVSRNVWTQSVGLGISVTRDVFLYPNLQFVALDRRAELTNVGLSLNLNL